MKIRKMTKDDILSVAGLERLIFSKPWSAKSLTESLKDPMYHFFTAEEDGIIVGYMGLYAVCGEGNITNIAVMPEYRRRGIGEALLKAMLESCREEGTAAVTLEVRESNRGAICLYEKYGFTIAGVRPGFYEEPREDAVIMWNDVNNYH